MTLSPYSFDTLIDSGAFGSICSCHNRFNNIDYSCEIIPMEIKNNEQQLQVFKHEICLNAQINHPNIIKLVDVMIDANNIYTIFDSFIGVTLDSMVQKNNGIDEQTAAKYFKQIMSGISYLHHRGIAHKEISLKSIHVLMDNTIKITEFGVYRHPSKSSGMTFVYMPPEVLLEKSFDKFKADIWTAGICLYAMTANHMPWTVNESTPVESVWEDIESQICSGEIIFDDNQSEMLQDLLSQMLSIEPDFRPDADEILNHPWLEMMAPDENIDAPEPNQKIIFTVNSLINDIDNK
ncbi:CAMK family protein kinase [Trichomonas vaginalis G3]|uniref:CAMK family protein kinase n=1 Tax=Trichomonas vaginalis (strain ATCC PRA-98 / G3) TaxID=412133 RepID=A2DZ99_TRIV3|nr:protein serine/threonine kinase protein [Trichomonas vaginalis G3]EAY14228.1 CAMK family protein kinase [Trichomonas vaginalis G3]KAI5491836.1 protein serine/threonine kinase protein [Trichomonas vaginalis G3]|eukprot:XP_001326451.1 CAMK family protein kinase [Trichomonas vaginalis G3]